MCSMDVRLQILGHVPFFSGLKHADLEQINSLFHENGYGPNDMICFAGDPARSLFVVADGRVKLMHHSLSGKNVLIDMLQPGEFFGSLSTLGNTVYPDTAEAQTQTCILAINANDFRHILEKYPSVALKVVDITAARLRTANDRIRQLSAVSVEGRIANILLHLSKKLGKASGVGLLIESPLTRDDLAAMSGSTGPKSLFATESRLSRKSRVSRMTRRFGSTASMRSMSSHMSSDLIAMRVVPRLKAP